MKKQLFFDDNKLFGRDNVVRKMGKPQLVFTYKDENCSTDFSTGYVFTLENGKKRMLYFAHGKAFKNRKLFSAISDDGISFAPEKIYDTAKNPEKQFSNEVMNIDSGNEIAYIYEDKHTKNPQEKYKLLMVEYDGDNLQVTDTVYTSANLLDWILKEGSIWGDGTEPIASVFYNKQRKKHTVVLRSFWGVRSVGYKQTKNWQTFSDFKHCLNVDSLDERLSEIYGMFAFEYEGMYIGLPHLYRNLNSELNAKYKNGIIDTQLAYSFDGEYWQRSLREPFISGLDTKGLSKPHNLVWVSSIGREDDGSVLLYAAASELEHGPAFRQPGTGKMLIYKLRQDGFVYFASDKKRKPSCISTREKVWQGGEFHINLKAKKATLAVYVSDESEDMVGNVLGISRPVEGYTHKDCIEFSGDSTNWVPTYKNGAKIDDLKGKTLVFELKFTDGEVYSFSGEYVDVFNTQAARYRKYGILP